MAEPEPSPAEIATPSDERELAELVLVEDDSGDAFFVEELLAGPQREFSVTWVRTLTDAASAIGPSTDCVLLDLGLPDTSDLDGLRTILALEPRPAVVVLTGRGDHTSGERAVALGAQDYLTKASVTDETLTRALRYAIARRNVEKGTQRLLQAELVQAENARLERGLLPNPLLLNPRLAWATRYETDGHRGVLGGDFYDGVEKDDGTIRILVGDVSGHGPDEAALGVALRVGWRALVLADRSPEETLSALERVLETERISEEVFATLCDVELEPSLRHARLRLAGHPSPLVFDGSAAREIEVSTRHPAIGVFGVEGWEPSTLELGPEDALILFTDGIIEGRSATDHGRLGSDGLARLATEAFRSAGTLRNVADELVAGAERANQGPLGDDVALVVLSSSPRWRT